MVLTDYLLYSSNGHMLEDLELSVNNSIYNTANIAFKLLHHNSIVVGVCLI